MKMFKAAILAYTGIIATVVSGAPVGGGGTEVQITDVVATGTVSFHVPTGFPASRFTGGPRKGPCGVECNTATEVNDKIGPTVMDPFGPRPTLNTSRELFRPGPTFTLTDPFKITFIGTPIQTSSDVDTRIPRTVTDSKSESESHYDHNIVFVTTSSTVSHYGHNIVFVTTSPTVSTGLSKTSEAASVWTPMLPPFNSKPPMTGLWPTLPEPRLTTIEPSTSSTLPEPRLTTIEPSTSSTLPEPRLTTIEPSTSSTLPEPRLTTIKPSVSPYTNTTQASSVSLIETAIILTTITQYVTPAPFATIAQTSSSAMVHTPKSAVELSFTTVVTAREPALSITAGETKTRHNSMGIKPFGRRA